MSHPQNVYTISAASQAFLDDATEMLALSGSSAEQFRRYVREYLAWCEANGQHPPLTPGYRERYRRYLESSGVVATDRQWRLRATYLNKLPAILDELRRRESLLSKRRRTRRIDILPPQSPLAQAIDGILGTATGTYRNSLRADIAVVLEWCAQGGTDATSLSLADIAAFDRWLLADGRRSRGPHFMARRLHCRSAKAEVWWT